MTVETTVLETKRVCSKCGRNWTHRYTRFFNDHYTTSELWHRDNNNGYWCQRCYSLYISTKKHNPVLNQRKIKYRGKRIYASAVARIGVCNYCRAVIGEIDAQTGQLCKQTQRHHEQYNDNNILMYSLEVCARCHGKTPKRKKAVG